jgi:hypothetical protein
MSVQFNNLLKVFRVQKKVAPKTFFEQLAEDGTLLDYLEKYMKDRFDNDEEFRASIFSMIEKYSIEVVPELEKYYLETLCSKLSFFEEYTKEWTAKH